MHFGIWQVLWLGLLAISLGISMALHGKPKEGKINFWSNLFAVVVEITIVALGGFFTAK